MKDTNPKDAIANDKVPLSLCSPVAMARWAEAMAPGRSKYGNFNYRVMGARSSVYVEGALRHLYRYLAGQDYDLEDMVTNLGAAMANIAIIIDAEAAGTLVDDRPPSVPLNKTYREIEDNVQKIGDKYKDRTPKHYTIADTSLAVHDELDEELFGAQGDGPVTLPATPLHFQWKPYFDAAADYTPGLKGEVTFYHPTYVQKPDYPFEPKYKVGDKVDVVWPAEWDGPKFGIVTKLEDRFENYDPKVDAVYQVTTDYDVPLWFSEEEMSEPSVRVGSRVRIANNIEDDAGYSGSEGVVSENDGTKYRPWYVALERGESLCFDAHELEVIG